MLTPLPADPRGVFDIDWLEAVWSLNAALQNGYRSAGQATRTNTVAAQRHPPTATLRRPTFIPEDPLFLPFNGFAVSGHLARPDGDSSPPVPGRRLIVAGVHARQTMQLRGNRGAGGHLEPVTVRSMPAQHRLGQTDFGGLLGA